MITKIIAVVGCVTGISGLVIQYLSHQRDRYLLDFSFAVNNRRSSPDEAFVSVLTISVINRGKSSIQVKEINWLNRHCNIKNESGFEVKDTDIRWKLYDGEKKGYIPIGHNERKEFHFPFSCPPLKCDKHSYIEVVDVLDKRHEKPTGIWPNKMPKG